MKFENTQEYIFGRAGESTVSKWLNYRGNTVIPIYEKMFDDNKGPRVFAENGNQFVAPDLMVFNKNFYFVEVKRKTAFSWYRKKNIWTTGIDIRVYDHYCKLQDLYKWEIWLFFLHEGGQAKDSPPNSPAGLFGQKLAILRNCENHRFYKIKSPMVYWDKENLLFLESLEKLKSIQNNTNSTYSTGIEYNTQPSTSIFSKKYLPGTQTTLF